MIYKKIAIIFISYYEKAQQENRWIAIINKITSVIIQYCTMLIILSNI